MHQVSDIGFIMLSFQLPLVLCLISTSELRLPPQSVYSALVGSKYTEHALLITLGYSELVQSQELTYLLILHAVE